MKSQMYYQAYQIVQDRRCRKQVTEMLNEWHEASKRESFLVKVQEVVDHKRKLRLFKNIKTGAQEVNRRVEF